MRPCPRPVSPAGAFDELNSLSPVEHSAPPHREDQMPPLNIQYSATAGCWSPLVDNEATPAPHGVRVMVL